MHTKQPTVEQLAAALDETAGQTPKEVTDAFVPTGTSAAGVPFVRLTLGHEMLLAQLRHPFSTGKKLEDSDVLTAFFVFTRPSTEGFAMIERGNFETEFFAFLETLPADDIKSISPRVVEHWALARATAIEMRSPHPNGVKKKAASGGCSPRLPELARRFASLLTRCFTKSRSIRSSP